MSPVCPSCLPQNDQTQVAYATRAIPPSAVAATFVPPLLDPRKHLEVLRWLVEEFLSIPRESMLSAVGSGLSRAAALPMMWRSERHDPTSTPEASNGSELSEQSEWLVPVGSQQFVHFIPAEGVKIGEGAVRKDFQNKRVVIIETEKVRAESQIPQVIRKSIRPAAKSLTTMIMPNEFDRALFEGMGKSSPDAVIFPAQSDTLPILPELVRWNVARLTGGKPPLSIYFFSSHGEAHAFFSSMRSNLQVADEGILKTELQCSEIEKAVEILRAANSYSGGDVAWPVRIRALDQNLVWETRSHFGFLPIRIGAEVFNQLHAWGALSITLAPTVSADKMRRLLVSMVEDRSAQVLEAILAGDGEIRIEVVGSLKNEIRPSALPTVSLGESIRRGVDPKAPLIFSGHHPGYHLYVGTLDRIARSHVFSLADDMQFVKNLWDNRQQFPSLNGLKSWLTVPLEDSDHGLTVGERKIHYERDGFDWRWSHWRQIGEWGRKRPHFKEHEGFFGDLYGRRWTTLVGLNEAILRYTLKAVGITDTTIIRSSQWAPHARLSKTGEYIAKNVDALVGEMGVDSNVIYLSGPHTEFLEEVRENGMREKDILLNRGVRIAVQPFSGEEFQRRSNRDPFVSPLVLLSEMGSSLRELFPPERGKVADVLTRRQFLNGGMLYFLPPFLWSSKAVGDRPSSAAARICRAV